MDQHWLVALAVSNYDSYPFFKAIKFYFPKGNTTEDGKHG